MSLDRRDLEQLQARARLAVEGFVQAILDEPDNAYLLEELDDSQALAEALWREGLIVVFRLLFIFKLERSASPPQFTRARSWTTIYSPTMALDSNREDLGKALRGTFQLLREGSTSSNLTVPPLGGTFFDPDVTPTLEPLLWSDQAVSRLLECLLFLSRTPPVRVPYDDLAVEDLGRIYEVLLDLEPGLTSEPMCKLRHPRLEVVVPESQGETFRRRAITGKKSSRQRSIQWVERLEPGRFYVRTGLGRKTTGSYYTPRSLVRFLVRETLAPKVTELSLSHDPRPEAILALRVLDPAMGSGHFLVEVCRYLGDALCESLRRCHDLAREAEAQAASSSDPNDASSLRGRAVTLRDRAAALGAVADSVFSRDRRNDGQLETACRREVASRCLYGVDLNPLAVELAKLVLWLESFHEGAPLPSLDHHLLCGDSLTGASLEHLHTMPGSRQPVPALLQQLLNERCIELLGGASTHAQGVGATSDREELGPLETLAAAWSGGAMLGADQRATDLAYESLLEDFLAGEDLEDASGRASDGGLGIKMIEVGRRGVPFEIVFPELATPSPQPSPRGRGGFFERLNFGFDAVVGNPPWDKVLPLEREFYAGYDVSVLAVPTARERRPLYEEHKKSKRIRAAWQAYAEPFAWTRRFIDTTYRWQTASVKRSGRGRRTSGHADRYRYFVERSWEVLSPSGRLGLVLPNTFYNASGATGVRHLILEECALEICIGFTNARGIFDIGLGQRFCLVVIRKSGQTSTFAARFGLDDPETLSGDDWRESMLDLDISFVERTSPGYLCFLELPSQADLDAVSAMYLGGNTPLSDALLHRSLDLYQEMNMTNDSSRFTDTAEVLATLDLQSHLDPRLESTRRRLVDEGWLIVHEKGTFYAYDDCQKSQPRYLCHSSQLLKGAPSPKLKALEASRYFRLVARSTIHATEADKSVFSVIPPACVVGNSALSESAPGTRPSAHALVIMAVCNSRPFNFVTKLRMGTNLNQFILESLPFPKLPERAEAFCAHGALRLVCNHIAYSSLWTEQLGDTWREGGTLRLYPVLRDPEIRRETYAMLDAVIAHAYGLERSQYEHILEAFVRRHDLVPSTARCLEAQEELAQIGLESFAKRYDPYWDIPLVMTLPRVPTRSSSC